MFFHDIIDLMTRVVKIHDAKIVRQENLSIEI